VGLVVGIRGRTKRVIADLGFGIADLEFGIWNLGIGIWKNLEIGIWRRT
jgi:hypothetical protein